MWQYYYKSTSENVKAYHVTTGNNVESILANGLIAKPCKATQYGDDRLDAVYMFAVRRDAYDTELRNFLFDETDLVVIEITIPEQHHENLREDGWFNMSAICSDGTYPTAMQYLGNIPAEWIKVIK